MLSCSSIALSYRRQSHRPVSAAGQAVELGEEPALGAHLVTSRRGYTHHGIYAGRGMVVHYAGLSRRLHSGPVEEVTLPRFSLDRPIGISRDREATYSPQEIVRRARTRLGENSYHVLRNNGEHFCNWCISGRSRSPMRGSVAAHVRSPAQYRKSRRARGVTRRRLGNNSCRSTVYWDAQIHSESL